jgi:hypothetical protein
MTLTMKYYIKIMMKHKNINKYMISDIDFHRGYYIGIGEKVTKEDIGRIIEL